ncbi:hypothetical protein SD77_1122 [Bacillus badius]|uniref:Mobile element protein n=1 Tax=Bacillus badius TaxID=1455 RepID=A0ABR5AUE4_BACBA|nr:hypothetical protein SD77_1122 [Bacillus badius]
MLKRKIDFYFTHQKVSSARRSYKMKISRANYHNSQKNK